MEPGVHVWCRDDDGDEAWMLAEVVKRGDDELKLKLVDNPSKVFTRPVEVADEEIGERKFQGVELANTKLSQEEEEAGRDNDLITLPHLHEPALLHALSERFFRGKIYTWTGPVLIAVNPFQRLPLYTNEILETYRRAGLFRSQGMGEPSELEPHVYDIADRAYRQMMSEQRKSQSILISGESGAGKTESTKIVMLYLTTLGAGTPEFSASDANSEGDLSIMQRVLQSNPVLEAFGNARTLRNDNSSRFGKFIELGFSRAGHLLGAKVQTYLLEKVRLAFHASGERNYHIFYQLLRGATEEDKKKYEFHDADTGGLELPNYFRYSGQGGAPHLREFTDESGLQYTLKAMNSLGWSQETIGIVLSLCAGILHLGQMQFNTIEIDGDAAAEIAEEKVLQHASRLMGVDEEKMKTALTVKVLLARGQEIRVHLTPDKAADARDALAKTIYGALFLWVVEQVNKSCGWENDNDVRSSCGVLDIFGFECFAVNSFEQLCINFTNEALQQQFNKFIFKLEQAEYESEKIQWAFISFPDNQDCLDTIQQKKIGILSMLDDECRLPNGSDRKWAMRMYEQYLPEKKQTESKNKRFLASQVQKGKAIFCVRHFAGVVEYQAETNFMEKNKDEIPLTAMDLFETAPSQLVRDIYAVQKKETEDRAPGGDSKKGGRAPKSKTVGQQFKAQLISLVDSVEKTDPHYIRCLKPNDAAKPKMLTRKRLTEQLRYGGVLEAVRVARAGYPVRLGHESFFERYRMVLPTTPEEVLPWSIEGGEPQKLCVKLVEICLEEGAKAEAASKGGKLDANEPGITRSEKIRRMQTQPRPMVFPKTDVQLGLHKVFMRKPPHDALEAHRVFHQHAGATIIESWFRGMQSRRRFLIIADAVVTAQRFYRGCKGRERWWTLRKAVAGMLFTRVFRMLIAAKKYNRGRKGAIQLQAHYRGHALRRELASIKVQKYYRCYDRRTKYQKLCSAILSLQCRSRVRIAKALMTELMREQKDIGKLKENNEKLKMEMASLKAMLQAQAKEGASKAANNMLIKEKEDRIAELEKRISELEKQLATEKKMVQRLEQDLKDQKESSAKEIENLKHSRVRLVAPPSPTRNPVEMVAPVARASFVDAPPPPMAPTTVEEARPHTKPAEVSPVQAMRKVAAAEANAAADAVGTMPHVPIPPMPDLSHYVSPERLAEHKAKVAKLENELEMERKLRREADGEIIKLRAAINGVQLNDSDVDALLAPKLDQPPDGPKMTSQLSSMSESVDEEDISQAKLIPNENGEPVAETPAPASAAPQTPEAAEAIKPSASEEELEKIRRTSVTPEVVTALDKLGIEEAKDNRVFQSEQPSKQAKTPRFSLTPVDILPMIRRGFAPEEKAEEPVVSVGWKVEVRNRKEREEVLRDEVHQFEAKMKKFSHILEEGVEVVMWQLNRGLDAVGGPNANTPKDDFTMKATHVTVKLHRRGELYVQSVIAFMLRGGYLSKAIGRNRGVDKSALEPLSLFDILEVKAGCSGYDHTELPASSGKSKSKSKAKNKTTENKQSNLFLTIKATPTPVASSRSYILRFKSRSARNDFLNGMRSILADMQIHEGVSVSGLHYKEDLENGMDEEVMVPLKAVHQVINKERQSYDRVILMLLQGGEDLKEKEDELQGLRSKLERVVGESEEKDRVQANDSKLIMQLSKKLETLLMENEDLRDQNDRLNQRLVAVECEKMNLMTAG